MYLLLSDVACIGQSFPLRDSFWVLDPWWEQSLTWFLQCYTISECMLFEGFCVCSSFGSGLWVAIEPARGFTWMALVMCLFAIWAAMSFEADRLHDVAWELHAVNKTSERRVFWVDLNCREFWGFPFASSFLAILTQIHVAWDAKRLEVCSSCSSWFLWFPSCVWIFQNVSPEGRWWRFRTCYADLCFIFVLKVLFQ